MNTTTTTPKPAIVLVHGLWMTPRSWDTWAERFRAAGHQVIVPGWPGIDDRSPAEIRTDPSALKGLGLKRIVDHYASIIRDLPERPIVMGHSFGGLIAQLIADRGLAAAVVAVTPGQPAGIPTLPLPTIISGLPVLGNPFRINGATQISKRHFHYTFGNDLSRAESDRIFEEQAVPAVNRVFFEGAAGALIERGAVSRVDYGRADRVPLLVITGELDHVVPPAVGRAIVQRYRKAGAPATVDYREFPGRTHRIVSQDDWQEVADYALDWALGELGGATAVPAAGGLTAAG